MTRKGNHILRQPLSSPSQACGAAELVIWSFVDIADEKWRHVSAPCLLCENLISDARGESRSSSFALGLGVILPVQVIHTDQGDRIPGASLLGSLSRSDVLRAPRCILLLASFKTNNLQRRVFGTKLFHCVIFVSTRGTGWNTEWRKTFQKGWRCETWQVALG